MSSKHVLSISITEHLAAFIRQEVEGGRYGSASEVVRAALRLLEEQKERSSPESNAHAMPRSAEPPAK
ncbi:type II toxin-antitoxin system ParD family antitoxin [Paraburkholderia caledonica]|uniref:type II toxin-antitoxin system ParD family antitoxin n=1 Tax=Paraburkholderia caledonica TaxID=134536 RepID=UPI0037093D52